MLLNEITMARFTQARERVRTAILPVGALEEHGPHLPLGLDAMHAWALAAETAKLKPCFVAPPLFYGMCRSTAQHAGTVGLSGDTLRSLVYDIGAGLWRQGVRNLCLLTGHAGGTHQSSLVEVGESLLESTGLNLAVVCVLELIPQGAPYQECPGDSHAGEVETSLALHLWPELVDGTAPEEYPVRPRFLLVRDKLGHWPGGVWGDPSLASAEKGRLILETEAQALVKVLEQLEALPPGPA
ncbi:MAG: creatininase family protein [Deltaproteobacteria bacterium]|nr:creatininase family protein [Deltaproteobacteria bacterium]